MQIFISQEAQEKLQKLTSANNTLHTIRLGTEFLGGCGADTDFSLTYGKKEAEDCAFSFNGFEILISPETKEMVASDLYIKLNSMNGFQLSTRSENLAYNMRLA